MLNISQAIDIINNKRNCAELKALNNLKLLQQDKLFAQLDIKIRAISFELAKRDTLSLDKGTLNEELQQLKQDFNKRIKELGFSSKDIEVQYSCPQCEDTGFVKGKYCDCLRSIIYDSINNSYIGPINKIDNFNKINLDYYRQEHRADYKHTFTQLKRYTEKFPQVIPFLLLTGGTGTGKTYMVSTINNVLIKKGYASLYLNACDLNDIFLKYHLADISDKENIFSPLVTCDLLIVDDLGSENMFKNVTIPYLYKLIINRYNKNTIITTNLNANEIFQRYDNRISSRLMDKDLTINVEIDGIDLRLERQ